MAAGSSGRSFISLRNRARTLDGGSIVGLMQIGVAADGVGKHMVVERGPRIAVQQRDDDERL